MRQTIIGSVWSVASTFSVRHSASGAGEKLRKPHSTAGRDTTTTRGDTIRPPQAAARDGRYTQRPHTAATATPRARWSHLHLSLHHLSRFLNADSISTRQSLLPEHTVQAHRSTAVSRCAPLQYSFSALLHTRLTVLDQWCQPIDSFSASVILSFPPAVWHSLLCSSAAHLR